MQVAEAAGFDFVSIQDHPYVPDFLDTFALIGTLIGQTSRLRFMTDVANLPLRPAQMLAKTSASLDVLSGDLVPGPAGPAPVPAACRSAPPRTSGPRSSPNSPPISGSTPSI